MKLSELEIFDFFTFFYSEEEEIDLETKNFLEKQAFEFFGQVREKIENNTLSPTTIHILFQEHEPITRRSLENLDAFSDYKSKITRENFCKLIKYSDQFEYKNDLLVQKGILTVNYQKDSTIVIYNSSREPTGIKEKSNVLYYKLKLVPSNQLSLLKFVHQITTELHHEFLAIDHPISIAGRSLLEYLVHKGANISSYDLNFIFGEIVENDNPQKDLKLFNILLSANPTIKREFIASWKDIESNYPSFASLPEKDNLFKVVTRIHNEQFLQTKVATCHRQDSAKSLNLDNPLVTLPKHILETIGSMVYYATAPKVKHVLFSEVVFIKNDESTIVKDHIFEIIGDNAIVQLNEELGACHL